VQIDAPSDAVKVPVVQFSQSDATCAPRLEENFPAAHFTQVAEETAVVAVEYVPAGQFVQADAPSGEYTPARQLMQVSNDVAPSLEE